MPDFFISYTSPDESWAEWIAWILEENGFNVVLQKWDFAAGSNFVLEMQKAAAEATRTIAVLSPNYLSASRFGASEWAAAFATDPDGMKRTLVPVRVRECATEGLLRSIVYVDLVGLPEDVAKQRLLANLKGGRRKPAARPLFPGPAVRPHFFPGTAGQRSPAIPSYVPKIRGVITDRDKRQFIREAFANIQRRFESSLESLTKQNTVVEFDIIPVDATKFTAEVFVSGKSRACCKVWIGGIFGGDEIAYAEGSASQQPNTYNEVLSLSDSSKELTLSATMSVFSRSDDGIDPKHMNPDEAAEYLWRRFLMNLEH